LGRLHSLDLGADLAEPVLGRGMRLEPALGAPRGRTAGHRLQEPGQPVRVVAGRRRVLGAQLVGFVLVLAVIALLDQALDDIAQDVLEDVRQ
jgi:hypothetical protein